MPFIKSLVSKCHAYTITLILLLGVIMPIYSYYTEKKLVYIIIMAFFLVTNPPLILSVQNQIYAYSVILDRYLILNMHFLYIFIVFKVCNFFI